MRGEMDRLFNQFSAGAATEPIGDSPPAWVSCKGTRRESMGLVGLVRIFSIISALQTFLLYQL